MRHVFISYRHESPEHCAAVRGFAQQLRRAGLPVELDQFYLEAHPGGPDDGGWPKWSEERANRSDCVLVIASKGWFAAYEGSSHDVGGHGAASEAHLFRQSLWRTKQHNERIRLVFLQELPASCEVPAGLDAWHQFRPLLGPAELQQLISWARARLLLEEAPSVSWPEPIPFLPDIADRTHEWPLIVALLAGRLERAAPAGTVQAQRILFIEASKSGLGKSTLIRSAEKYAIQLGLPVVHVDFKHHGVTVDGVVGRFHLELSELLPNFARENKVHLLRKDLRSLRQPVLLLFDSYETADANKTLADFVTGEILPEVPKSPAVAVIVAGQVVPEAFSAPWRESSRKVELKPITNLEDWLPWIDRNCRNFLTKGADLKTILLLTSGNPKLTAELCQAIEKAAGA